MLECKKILFVELKSSTNKICCLKANAFKQEYFNRAA